MKSMMWLVIGILVGVLLTGCINDKPPTIEPDSLNTIYENAFHLYISNNRTESEEYLDKCIEEGSITKTQKILILNSCSEKIQYLISVNKE